MMLQPTHISSFIHCEERVSIIGDEKYHDEHYYGQEASTSRGLATRTSPRSVLVSSCQLRQLLCSSSPNNKNPHLSPEESSSCYDSIVTASSATFSTTNVDIARQHEENQLVRNDIDRPSTARAKPFRDTVFDGCPFFHIGLPEKEEGGNEHNRTSPPPQHQKRDNKVNPTIELCADDHDPFQEEEVYDEEDEDNTIEKTSDLNRDSSADDRIQLCHLLQPSDRKLTTDFTLAIMDQVDFVFLGLKDRKLSRRKLHPTRYAGLACRHCKPGDGQTGRYFPSTLKTLSDPQKTLHAIHKHLTRCVHCPNSVKLKIIDLQRSHKDQNMVLMKDRRGGGKRTFYRRIWALLHDISGADDSS